MTAFQQHWVPHPLQSYRKGWVIERTGVPGERFCSLGWRTGVPGERFCSLGWRTGVPGERFCSLGWRSETAVAYLHAAETSKGKVEY
jgi:hypothetical protein